MPSPRILGLFRAGAGPGPPRSSRNQSFVKQKDLTPGSGERRRETRIYVLTGAESVSVRFRLIIIALALAGAVWALWPTFNYYQINGERENLLADTATPEGKAALARWDSLHYEDWLSARDKRIKLGLDLRGGVYFTMEVDAPTLLEESVGEGLMDQTFEQVMAATREEAATSDESVLDIFTKKFDEIARPQGKTLLNYYDFGDMGSDAGDDAIIAKLRTNINDAVDQAQEVIRQRIDKFGLTEPLIQKQGSRRIAVELPDETDPGPTRDLLSKTARLEFKLVKNDATIVAAFQQIDRLLGGKTAGEPATPETPGADTTLPDTDTTGGANGDTNTQTAPPTGDTNTGAGPDTAGGQASADTTADTSNPYAGLDEEEQVAEYRRRHPFGHLFNMLVHDGRDGQRQSADGLFEMNEAPPMAEYTFYTTKENRAKIQEILKRPEVRSLIPEDRQIAFSASPVDPKDPQSAYEMYVVSADASLTGEVVVDAMPSTDVTTGQNVVQMAMDAAGADRWAEITDENTGKRVAVVLDSVVYSAPWIQGKIAGGQTQITGMADYGEANLLSIILKSGALKAPIKIIEERVVGPSLGADQIDQGINAVLFAALLVVLFMAIYYAFGGIIADLAVVLNVFFTLAFLAALGGTLTLPGIGAIVLTIGMAVDANILIYERIREEMALGKTLQNAVQLGYERAFSAIIDSNITTFLTGAILAAFGSGPIKGFAVMLMIGIGSTLFTAVFITRAVFTLMLDRGAHSINFGQPKSHAV